VEYLETLKKGARIEIDSTDPERAAQVLARMIADGLKVIEFHREERNLEEAFIDLLESTNKPVPEPLLKTLQES
jgi:ABC-2 type transport system ATP-binding protein